MRRTHSPKLQTVLDAVTAFSLSDERNGDQLLANHAGFNKRPRAEREAARKERRAAKVAAEAMKVVSQQRALQRVIDADKPTEIEAHVARRTGATLAQIHAARALIAKRENAESEVSAPAPKAREPKGTITAQDRAIAKHSGLTEEQLQQAADLRAKRLAR